MLNNTVYYFFFYPTLLLVWGLCIRMDILKGYKITKLEHWTYGVFGAMIAPIPFLLINYFLKAGWVEDPSRFIIHHLTWYSLPLVLVAKFWRKKRNEEKKPISDAPNARDKQKKSTQSEVMLGRSMNDNDFVKLSHFDRIRRGYFDKIPMNFCFIGLLFALNLFYASTNVMLVLGACLFVIGFFLKEKLIVQDNAEIQKYSHEIENEHQKYLKQMKG